MNLRPFDAGNWFPINNAIFDCIMARLSPNAFKILMVAIRYTWGWSTAGGKRKTEDVINYRQFKKMSGISSFETIHNAIIECLDKKMLLRTEIQTSHGNQKPTFSYRLNIDFEIETTTETVAASTTETVAASTTETVASKERKKQTKDGDVSSSEQIIIILTAAGVEETVAQKLAETIDIETVQGWLAYCEKQKGKLTDPVAFLVSRLKKRKQPPTIKSSEEQAREKRHRYVEGKYAAYIRH